MIVAGVVIARPAGDPHVRRSRVLGGPVLVGIGAVAVVVGAYLGGSALVAVAIPDGPFLSEEPPMPSPTLLIVFLFGVPAVALLGLAVKGLLAGVVGLGVVVPVLAVWPSGCWPRPAPRCR